MVLLEAGYTTTFFHSTPFVFFVSLVPALIFVGYVLWDDRRMARMEKLEHEKHAGH